MRSASLLFILLLVSCGGNHDIKSLRPDIDKLEDARSKYGEPDTVFRRYDDGLEKEYWYYDKDSTGLIFINGKLSEIRTAAGERAKAADQAKEEERQAQRLKIIRDSIEASINK